ncbi:MAG: hypothetical protein H3C35_07465 [Bacteroidetes bacterium]|nr:hypothetical protein [Bacteroidota bacterium]
MFDFFDSETVWLNVTNFILGLVTVICFFAVGKIFFKEVYVHFRERVKVPALQDDHSFIFSDLGITMADGGKPFNENELKKSNANDDETHITRAEN